MRVTVTGATGHLGGVLVRSLVEEGRTVRAIVHDRGEVLDGVDVERVAGDVTQLESLERAFAGSDVVYHLAARIQLVMGDGAKVRRVNIDGTRNVIEACRRAGVRRLVHFSSIHSYAHEPENRVIDETAPLVEADAPLYSLTKAQGEKLVLTASAQGLIDAVVIQPTGCMGPLDFEPSAIGQVLIDLHHRRVPALVDGGFNWVDVRDVVRAAIAAEKHGRRSERYLVAGTWQPVIETAELAASLTGSRPPRMVVPMWMARAAAPFAEAWTLVARSPVRFSYASLHALRYHRKVNDAKARRELGHAPRPIEQTIEDTYAWFRDAGRLG